MSRPLTVLRLPAAVVALPGTLLLSLLLSLLLGACQTLPASSTERPDPPAPVEVTDESASSAAPAAEPEPPAAEAAAALVRQDPPNDDFPRPTSPPSPPSEVTDPSETGAVAAARHWFVALNWANWSNDAQPLAQGSHPECADCKQVFDAAVDRAQNGYRVDGGMTRVDRIEVRQVVEPALVLVDVRLTREGAQVVGAADPESAPSRSEQDDLVLAVVHEQGRWTVADLGDAPA